MMRINRDWKGKDKGKGNAVFLHTTKVFMGKRGRAQLILNGGTALPPVPNDQDAE
jgi:hypothetical protein